MSRLTALATGAAVETGRLAHARPGAGEVLRHDLRLSVREHARLGQGPSHLERNGDHVADGIDVGKLRHHRFPVNGDPARLRAKAGLLHDRGRAVGRDVEQQVEGGSAVGEMQRSRFHPGHLMRGKVGDAFAFNHGLHLRAHHRPGHRHGHGLGGVNGDFRLPPQAALAAERLDQHRGFIGRGRALVGG